MEKWDQQTDGEISETAIRSKMTKRGCTTVDKYTYSIGCYFPEHTHQWPKLDAVVTGTLRIVLEGVAHDLGPGDMIHIPKGTVHTAQVMGNQNCVSLDGSLPDSIQLEASNGA